jgi:CPA2 family monovalent cation:H+ antiporter-2
MKNYIPLFILRKIWTGQFSEKACSHLAQIRVTQAPDPTLQNNICAECVQVGDTWPALRLCMICGYIGCCDKSKNKDASKHFADAGHPLFRAITRGEDWVWCYVDKALLKAPSE